MLKIGDVNPGRRVDTPELLVIDRNQIPPHRSAARDERPPAARIAADVFIEFMRAHRVRPYDIATRCRTRTLTRHVPVGPRQEIVCSFDLALLFWPVTIDDARTLTGYGIDRDGACVRYTRNPHPLTNRADEMTVYTVQFAAGCQNVMRRATRSNPAFICEPLSGAQAVAFLTEYLIDATLSLTEGRGPLLCGQPDQSHFMERP